MNKYVVEITPQDCGWVFSEYGTITTKASTLFSEPENVALVIFTGGDDVWPGLYGEKAIWETSYNTQRDEYEGRMFDQAQKYDIPCVGICRGSQFLCVKSGGKLVQDISGHGGVNHKICTNDGRILICNSSHHQMQLPSTEAIPLAWSNERRSNRYKTGDGFIVPDREYEVVYYPNINSLGMQFHPEWLSSSHEATLYAQEIVRDYLFGEKKNLKVAAK